MNATAISFPIRLPVNFQPSERPVAIVTGPALVVNGQPVTRGGTPLKRTKIINRNAVPPSSGTPVRFGPANSPGGTEAAVRLRGVSKSFGFGYLTVRALKQTNFEAQAGELHLITGPSGCGKTTLLGVIAGTLDTAEGEVEVFGESLHTLDLGELTAFRRRHVGFISQYFNLIPTLTLIANVCVPLLVTGAAQEVAEARAAAMLEKVGLGGRGQEYPRALNSSEQQLVAIARALVHEPHLVVCDEPTSALDAKSGARVMELLCEVARQPKRCVIVASRENNLARYADRVTTMADGRVENAPATEA